MTWIFMILRSKLAQAVIAALALLGAAKAFDLRGAKRGRKNLESELKDDAVKRVEQGNKAVSAARDESPADQLLRNRQKW